MASSEEISSWTWASSSCFSRWVCSSTSFFSRVVPSRTEPTCAVECKWSKAWAFRRYPQRVSQQGHVRRGLPRGGRVATSEASCWRASS